MRTDVQDKTTDSKDTNVTVAALVTGQLNSESSGKRFVFSFCYSGEVYTYQMQPCAKEERAKQTRRFPKNSHQLFVLGIVTNRNATGTNAEPRLVTNIQVYDVRKSTCPLPDSSQTVLPTDLKFGNTVSMF